MNGLDATVRRAAENGHVQANASGNSSRPTEPPRVASISFEMSSADVPQQQQTASLPKSTSDPDLCHRFDGVIDVADVGFCDASFDKIALLEDLQRNDKLSTNGNEFQIMRAGKLQFLERWWYDEDVTKNAVAVGKLYDTGFAILNLLMDRHERLSERSSRPFSRSEKDAILGNQQRINRYRSIVDKSIGGLRRWHANYVNEKKTTAATRINTLVLNVCERLQRVNQAIRAMPSMVVPAPDGTAGKAPQSVPPILQGNVPRIPPPSPGTSRGGT
jgi:hypothetical protein